MKFSRFKRLSACMTAFGILLSLSGGIYSAGAAEETAGKTEPYILYTGNTWHQPGDVALVRGDHLNLVERVEIQRLSDNGRNARPGYIHKTYFNRLETAEEADRASEVQWSSGRGEYVQILQQTEKSLKFVVPSTMKEGVYAVKLHYSAASSRKESYYYLNAPAVEWVQGDEGSLASPGGWLRIQGSNLSVEGREDRVKVVLENTETGKRKTVKVSKIYDAYSVEAAVPEDMEAGRYRVYLYNGYGASTSWSVPYEMDIGASPRKSWPETVFNVKDYGAVGDGTQRDDAAFQAALDAAKENGGGVVYFPAGRYMLVNSFVLPEKTVICGDKAEETLIFWTPFDWDYDELPEYMLTGARDFMLRDITFSGARIGNVVVGGEISPVVKVQQLMGKEVEDCENIYIDNCRFHFDSYGGGPSLSAQNMTTVSNKIETELAGFKSKVLEITADNVQITNCEILSSDRPVVCFTDNLLFRNISIPTQGWSGCYGENIIFEDITSSQTWGFAGSRIYSARVSVENRVGNNRETMTFDGGYVGYTSGAGTLQEDGVTVKLEGADFKENQMAGYQLYIIGGAGEGQMRTIVSNTADSVTVAEPFMGALDDTTMVTVSESRDAIYFTDWDSYNSGPFQLYGFGTNVVIDGLDLQRMENLISRAGKIYNVYQVNWYVSIVNNVISDSNYFKFYGYDLCNNYTRLQVIGSGDYSGLNIGTLLRNNTLKDGAYIQLQANGKEALQDLIIQENTIENAPYGIYWNAVGRTVRGVLMADNIFKDVDAEIYGVSDSFFDQVDNTNTPRVMSLRLESDGLAGVFSSMSVLILAGVLAALCLAAVLLRRFLRQKEAVPKA